MSGQFKKYGGVSNYQKSEQIQTDSVTSNYLQTRNFISQQFNGTTRKYMLTINDDVISANDNRIQNIADPFEPGDAVNLEFFRKYTTNVDGGYVMRSGDTMTGPLKMINNSYIEIDADEGKGRFSAGDGAVYIESSVENGTINFSYLDSAVPIFQLNTKTGLESIIAYANLDMKQKKISNLPNPTNDTDAVTLGYLQTNYTTNGDSNINNQTITLKQKNDTMPNIYFKNLNGTQIANIGFLEHGDTNLGISASSIDLNASSLSLNGDVDITGTINLNNNKLTSLGNPTNDTDAVNLSYLKSYVSGNTTGDFVRTSGDSMSGPLTITPVASHKPNPALIVNNANIMDAGYTYTQYLTQKNLGTVRDGAAIRIQNTTDNDGSTYIGHLYVGGQGNAGYIQSQDNGVPVLSNSWSNFLLNPKGGNVGIGLSAPVEVIDINGSAMIRGNSSAAIRLTTQSGETFIETGSTTDPGSTADLYFTSMDARNKYMVIKANGLVGINTIEPKEQLDVYGTAQFNNGDNYMNVSSVGTVHINTQGSDEEQLILSSQWHQMVFQCDYGTGETLIDVIRSNNAKIDIGAYSDNSEAHTTYDVEGGQSNIIHYGNVTCKNNLTMNGSVFEMMTTAPFRIEDTFINKGANGHSLISNRPEMNFFVNGTNNPLSIGETYINLNQNVICNNDLTVNDVINVGESIDIASKWSISNNADQFSFGVKGGSILFALLESPEAQFDCKVQSQGFLTSSDERLKSNIQDIPDALSVIKKLNVKKYVKTGEFYEPGHNFSQDSSGNYIDDSGNIIPETQQEIGIIAQDVRDNVDELSHIIHGEETITDACGNTVNKSLAVSYHDIFALNVQATQELEEKQSLLEQQVNSVVIDNPNNKHFIFVELNTPLNLQIFNIATYFTSITQSFGTYEYSNSGYKIQTTGVYTIVFNLAFNDNLNKKIYITERINNSGNINEKLLVCNSEIEDGFSFTIMRQYNIGQIIDYEIKSHSPFILIQPSNISFSKL